MCTLHGTQSSRALVHRESLIYVLQRVATSPRIMPESPMILAECEEINSLLYKPIAATQRIKYTCINVSVKYIVLGSTSGSLYLFVRQPCAFQQLIPLSEGPVSCVVISPDEKIIALATKRGTVCLIGLKPAVKLLAVSGEHLGETVTSLCWNDNSSEIYIGDGIGKISTMVLSIFTVNGMFQAPACALMHLDSTIVQMQFSGHLLLVSTMTRCYICDTVQEQFKQIGNKARDGEFGACFLASKPLETESISRTARRPEKDRDREETFDAITDKNDVSTENRATKIYCARPGCRLWEVTCNGTVVKTHQFKDALGVSSSPVYRANGLKFSKTRQIEQNWTSQQVSTNFSRLYVLRGKYLFSHTHGSVCVIDPTNAAVILWNNEYPNIAMARTINDRIYLMRANGIFHCLRLTTAETLILKYYEDKSYNECLRACKTFKPEYLQTTIGKKYIAQLANDDNEHANYSSSEQYEIAAILVPIISLIKTDVSSQPIKLDSGIVVVNSGGGKFRLEEQRNFGNSRDTNGTNEARGNNHRSVNEFNDDDNVPTMIGDLDPVIFENFVKKRDRADAADTRSCIDLMSAVNINDTNEPSSDGDSSKKVESALDELQSREIDETTLKIRMDLSSVYMLINSLATSMRETEMENAIIEVRDAMSEINENHGKNDKLKDFLREILRSTERHYCNALLENTRELLIETKNGSVIDEIARSFVDVNSSFVAVCACGYSYPSHETREPKFLETGITLLEKFFKNADRESCTKLCNSVTFMWRYYLPMAAVDLAIIDDVLCMCLRTRDSVLLSTLLPMLDTRQWEIAVECIRDMEMGNCPRCDRTNEHFNAGLKMEINWSEVARELVKREGTSSAMTFLVLVETVLPDVVLDKSIFQSLIFTGILDRHGLGYSVDFNKSGFGNDDYGAMCSPQVQKQLLDCIEKDLERPIERNPLSGGPYHWGMRLQVKSSTCPCCTLSLHTPVLLGENGISLFPCGHVYHVNCLIQRKLSRCNLH